MNPAARRLPWVIWGIAIVLLGVAFFLGVRNGSISQDPTSAVIFIMMMVGYVSIGALVASRVPNNPIGWLLMTAGGGFLIQIVTSEYAAYALYTNPGALPFPYAAAWLSNWVFVVSVGSVTLMLALFPTGSAASLRWRWLPPAIIADIALGVVATILRAGPLDVNDLGPDPLNPTGVQALTPLLRLLGLLAGIVGIGLALLAVVSLVLRYRAAQGEVRQQIRWLAYVVLLAVFFLILTIATALGLEEGESSPLNDAFFLAFFVLFAIGIPSAAAIAVLRYRLWDLDVVVKKTIVAAVLVLFLSVASLFALLVIGGLVVGPLADSPGAGLLAGIGIGILCWPLLRLSRRLADRIVYGGRATPYEVLAAFSDRMAESYATDDVLPRMAAILGAGAGAESVTVWLLLGDELHPAATWPDARANGAEARFAPVHETFADLPGDVFVVRHQGEQLGALTISTHANDPMNPSKERLIKDLAGQAGLVLRNVRLIEELRASRRRLVTAQDQERRRLERNIHDGAQQQLVALQVKQRLADGLVERDPARARELLAELQADTADALENLRDLARGIYPPLLADEGLAGALEAQARRSSIPVAVDADGVGRLSQEVEATVYFCVLEALQNVTKYADAHAVDIQLRRQDGELGFDVHDDGIGFDPAVTSRGTGLRGMTDRVEAIGGSLEIRSTPGEGTRIRGRVPIR